LGPLLAEPRRPWASAGVPGPTAEPAPLRQSVPLHPGRRILAVVPHYRGEAWLDQCLFSLSCQTRPPDGIVVVDDGSTTPPLDIVRRHPGVTLMGCTQNGGPYRVIQEVIRSTSYDGYLMQDADDWSSVDRLEVLLREAERTGAEMVGSQELRWDPDEQTLRPFCFPADVNFALAGGGMHHALLHGTSLIGRALLDRVGGFATGLRFGGDTEFLLRAHYAGRIVNVPRFCYVRRVHPDSLIHSPTTGTRSPARQQLRAAVEARVADNARRAGLGQKPDLTPLAVGPPIRLTHLTGPDLAWAAMNRS
jgi:glycosyltransferase involved in cell wall biosynthesis